MKSIVTSVVCLFFSLQLPAAEIEIPGQIIFDDEVRSVVFLVPVKTGYGPAYEYMQSEVSYYSDSTKVELLTPPMAKEFRFAYLNEVVRMKSLVYIDSHNKRIGQFLRVAMEGPLNVFISYSSISGYSYRGVPNGSYPYNYAVREEYLFQKGTEPPISCNLGFAFNKRMAEYLADCPVLSNLVLNRDFTHKDIPQIAIYYNSRCGANADVYKADGEKTPGEIIMENDTMNVTLRLFLQPNESLAIVPLQLEIVYLDSNGDEHKVHPSKAKEVRFKHGRDSVRMISKMFMTPGGNVDTKFLKLVMHGPVSVFEHHIAPPDNSMAGRPMINYQKNLASMRVDYVFQKGEKGVLKFCDSAPNFKKQMSGYFSDCPSLDRLISRGDFKINNVLEIARFYNSRCIAP